MVLDCWNCEYIGEIEFPFGFDVTCPKCGTVYETDWDYISPDNMNAWVIGIKEVHDE